MTSSQAFNRKIKTILTEHPESGATRTIRKIENLNPNCISYYRLFDDFGFKLGIGMITNGIVDRHYEVIGYIPSIKYYPHNVLGEEPRTYELFSDASPMSLNKCYEHLAKAIVYRIMSIPDFESVL